MSLALVFVPLILEGCLPVAGLMLSHSSGDYKLRSVGHFWTTVESTLPLVTASVCAVWRLTCIPGAARKHSEGGVWIGQLTWSRKIKGTRACWESSKGLKICRFLCCKI